MHIDAQPMSGTVHVELLETAVLQHLVQRALAQAEIDVALRQNALRGLVVFVEFRSRLDHRKAGHLRRQHQFVDVLLRPGELAVHWKRARDVRRVAVVFAAGVDQQQVAVGHQTVVVAIMQHARVGTGGDDRWIGDGLCAVAQEFVQQLGFGLVFVPARPRGAHRALVRSAGDRRRLPHQFQLVIVLDEAHRVDGTADVDDIVGRRYASARAIAHLIQQLRDLLVPGVEQPQWREQRRPVRRQLRQLFGQRGNGMGFVEAENFPGRIGAIAETIPDFTLGVLFAAEQHVLVAIRPGDQRDDRLRLRKAGQVIEVTVEAVRECRIAAARHFGRGGHQRQAAAGMRAHRSQDRRTARAIELMRIFHGHVRIRIERTLSVRAATPPPWHFARKLR